MIQSSLAYFIFHILKDILFSRITFPSWLFSCVRILFTTLLIQLGCFLVIYFIIGPHSYVVTTTYCYNAMWAPVLVVKILGKPLKGVLAEAPPVSYAYTSLE